MKLDATKRNHMIIILFKYGYTLVEIADALGVDPALIEEVLRQRINVPQR